MAKQKTLAELQSQLVETDEQLHKLQTKHATLRARITKQRRASDERLYYVYGKLVVECGLRKIPLAELQKAFKKLADQWIPPE